MTTITNDTITINAGDTLDQYERTIRLLDTSIREYDKTRATLDEARRLMDLAEARIIVAGLDGKNEAERKAHLTLALHEDAQYRLAADSAREACEALRNAERVVTVSKETCRMLRAAIALRAPTE